MSRARISITIPEPLLKLADRHAAQLDRSRSWLVSEALRRYLEVIGDERRRRPEASVRESLRGPAYPAGLGEHRLAQLEADLGLSPEDRVREAEETARLAEMNGGRWHGQRLLTFDRYEEYLAWKRWDHLSPP